MTNPYQAPATVGESPHHHRPFWRLLVGLICILAAILPILYGGLMVLAVAFAGSSISSGSVTPGMILILGGLILLFGLGLAAFGLGLWLRVRRMTTYGTAAVFLSVIAYIATGMFLF